MFVFRHQRLRLKAFWRISLLRLGVLLGCYAFHWAMGTLAALVLCGFYRKYLIAVPDQRHLGGAKLVPLRKVKQIYRKLRSPRDPGFLWGGVQIPAQEACTHFLVSGASGSGKTLTLRLLMQSLFATMNTGSNRRAIIYDAKRDMLSLLSGMEMDATVYILNPFDDRCVAWAIGRDVTTQADAQTLADLLIAKDLAGKEDQFFQDAALLMLQGMTRFFIKYAPGLWTLRDLVLGLDSLETAVALLGGDPEFRSTLTALGTDKTADNIMSTVTVKLNRYRVIAALWDRAAKSISLSEWATSTSILILGRDNKAKTTLGALNRLIFTRAAQILLDSGEVQEPSTFIVLDELPSLGKVEPLQDLANEGRSKGVVLVLGFQSFKNLEQVYGSEAAHTITGQFRHKAFLKMDEPMTADWACKLIGQHRIIRQTSSYNHEEAIGNWLTGTLNYGAKASKTEQIQTEYLVLPADLLNIPPVGKRQGLTGYYSTRANYCHTYSPRFLRKVLRPKGEMADFIPVPDHFQELRPWDEQDWERLGITHLMLQAQANAALREQPGHLLGMAPNPLVESADEDEFADIDFSFLDEDEASGQGGASSGAAHPIARKAPLAAKPQAHSPKGARVARGSRSHPRNTR